MENHFQKTARLDAAVEQAHADLRETLYQLHNLSDSLRQLRMQLDVFRALRTAQLAGMVHPQASTEAERGASDGVDEPRLLG